MKKKVTLKTLTVLLIALTVLAGGCAREDKNMAMEEVIMEESTECVESENWDIEMDIEDGIVLEPIAILGAEEELADGVEQNRVYTHNFPPYQQSGERWVTIATSTSSGQSWYGTDSPVYLRFLNSQMYELLFKIPSGGVHLAEGTIHYFYYKLPEYAANFTIENYPAKLYTTGNDAWKVDAIAIADYAYHDPNRNNRTFYVSYYENHLNGIVIDGNSTDPGIEDYYYFIADLKSRFTFELPTSSIFDKYWF